MPRDNFYSHQHRSRSRSFSAYRYNSGRHHDRRMPSPAGPARFHKRSESPPPERYRHQPSRSPSPVQRNGGHHRNGHRSRSPEVGHERSRRQRSSSGAPEPSSVLGVFGLHVRTSEGEIRDIFERYGAVDKIHMVYDAKSHSFRGYCFIYYAKQRDATTALNETNGIEVKERRIRVDYSKTKRAHTPTPGMYRGKRGQRNRSMDRQRPFRRDFGFERERHRGGGDDYPRHRSRERFDRSHREARDIDRSDGMRHRPAARRRSMEREFVPRARSPRRDSFRRRDRS